MKTKKIAKILGLGLAAALAFSLGAGIGISPASADVHEWSTITTPSWEDYVIFPDSEILDYAVGGEDGNTVYAVVTDNTLELGSGTYAGPGGIAEWSTEQEVDGSYSAKLQAPAPGVGSDGDKAWVCIIPCEDVTVDSLSSFSYDVYSTLGQPAYAKFYIDVNGDGMWNYADDDYLTLEPWHWPMIYEYGNANNLWNGNFSFADPIESAEANNNPGIPAWYPDPTNAPNDRGMPDWDGAQGSPQWLTISLDQGTNGTVLYSEHAFGDRASWGQDGIDDILLPWSFWEAGVTSGPIADPDEAFTGRDAAGTTDPYNYNPMGISPGDQILRVCIQVDDWVRESESYVDNVDIDGITYDLEPTGEMLLKSDDGGITWTDITEEVQDASGLTEEFVALSHVAVAPDDEDWLAVAGTNDAGIPMVVASEDGGDNFSFADDIEDTGNSTALATIYDLAVSSEVDDIHNIAAAGINDAPDGAIFRLEAGTWLTGSWDDTSFYDGWDDSVGTALPDVDSNAVIACAFSPNFDLDDTIACMTAAENGAPGEAPYIQQGTWGSDNSWNNEAAFTDAILITSNGDTLRTDIYVRAMGLALPADYDGTDGGARAVYCYVNAYNVTTALVGGFLFRVDDGDVSEPYGPSGEPILASIDFHGDADTGKMIVGEYVQWENDSGDPPGEAINAECCEGVNVWHTVELDPCCPDWELACKNPSGPYMAVVTYTPDGDKVYATTSGLLDDYPGIGFFGGSNDESAFSVSLDDGVSFNQLSLIDTDIDYLSDLVVCPDCSVIYLSSVNEDEECQVCACDSVWRSYDNGDTWERIFHGDWSDSIGTRLELRLPCEDTEDCCTLYLGVQHTDQMYYSRDCGQCWTQTPGTKIDIYDFAVEAENTVYVLDADGYVSMSTQFGRRWSDEVDTEVGSGHTITACCVGDLIVVGGNGDEPIAWSDDGGESWTLSDDLDGRSDQTVHVTCDPVCEGIIYAATDGAGSTHGTIYRVDTADGSVTDLEPMPYDYTGIVMSRQGVLYAASDEISVYYDPDDCCGREIVDTSEADEYYSGVVRNLDPCDTACCGAEDWDYLYTGTDPFDGWPWEADTDFDAQPSSLRICGCLSMDTNSVLYAIDRNATFGEYYDVVDGSDGTVWTYEDCTAKKAPEIVSPMCGEDIPSEPCEGCTNVDINLCWTNICDACYYDIEIATDEDFTQTVYQYHWWDGYDDLDCYEPADCADPCFLIPNGALQAGTTYYWHVRVSGVETGECVKSQWSETCSFSVMAGAGAGVSLLAPEPGATSVGIESVGFSWSAVGGATSYSFVFSPNSDLSGALASEELSGTAYTYTGMLDYSTPYFWQVTAWKNGNELSTSDIGTFTTAAEPEPAPEPPPPAEPPPDIVIPAAEQITPNWIIAMIAVGAALAVLVIVLIVRTRRP